MTRQWKPGDLALIEAGCWANHKIALRLAEGWSHVNGVNMDGDGVVSPVRPLVAIDPEDFEGVTVLMRALWNEASRANVRAADVGTREMQVALRSLIEPPKPEEPTGLGAVVEDADGHIHVRAPRDDGRPWVGSDGKWRSWENIAAVKVLSEGIPS